MLPLRKEVAKRIQDAKAAGKPQYTINRDDITAGYLYYDGTNPTGTGKENFEKITTMSPLLEGKYILSFIL